MYYVSGEEAWYLYGLDSSYGLLSMTCYELITRYSEANPISVSWDKLSFGFAEFSIAEEVNAANAATEPTTTEPATTAAAE